MGSGIYKREAAAQNHHSLFTGNGGLGLHLVFGSAVENACSNGSGKLGVIPFFLADVLVCAEVGFLFCSQQAHQNCGHFRSCDVALGAQIVIFVAFQDAVFYGKNQRIPTPIIGINIVRGGNLKEFDPKKTLEYVDDVIGNKEKYVEKLAQKEAELEKMAHRNEKYLAKLLARVKK